MDDIAARAGVTQEVWDLSQVLAEHLWEGGYVPGIGDTGDYVIDPRRLAQIILDAGYTPPTPPADDVREALADLLISDRVMRRPGLGRDYAYVEAEAIQEAFYVRPRNTFTNSEVWAALNCLWDGYVFEVTEERMRAALEAAWNA